MAKLDVLLVAPPTKTHRTPEENLGAQLLTNIAKENGYTAKYLDCWVNNINTKKAVNLILNLNPKVVGFSVSMDSIGQTIELGKKLRHQNYKGYLMLGGVYATFEAERLLRRYTRLFNGVIIGEADNSFVKFLKTLDLSKVPNAVYVSKNGKVIKNKKRVTAETLDNLPFPDRSTLETIKKLKTPVHVSDSRGCYGNCDFCSINCYIKFSKNKSWRGRSPENIVGELEQLCSRGVTMVKFVGDNFFGPGQSKYERSDKIANLIKQKDLNIRFRLSTRVNDVNYKAFKKLKEAGLFAVSVGVESGVQRKLDDFNKGTTVRQNKTAMEILKKLGIYAQMGLIMFDPYVTIEELAKEIKFIKEVNWGVIKGIGTKLFTPDGTPITEKIRKDVGFIEKKEANNIYRIKDPHARWIYNEIKKWEVSKKGLTEMVIDPVSAPKNVTPSQMRKFHNLTQKLKRIDIKVFEACLSKCQINKELDLNKYKPALNKISREVQTLYKQAGLVYNASENRHL